MTASVPPALTPPCKCNAAFEHNRNCTRSQRRCPAPCIAALEGEVALRGDVFVRLANFFEHFKLNKKISVYLVRVLKNIFIQIKKLKNYIVLQNKSNRTARPIGPLESSSVRPGPVSGRSDATTGAHPVSGARRPAPVEKTVQEGISNRG